MTSRKLPLPRSTRCLRLICILGVISPVCWFAESKAVHLDRIRFINAAAKAGVGFVVKNSGSLEKHLIETMISGVAVFDYNNDGKPDIYFVNGANIASLAKTDASFYNRLYRNNGDGTFTDVTEAAGVRGVGYGMGVAIGDYDNDGFEDIFLPGVNRNVLYHN